MMNGTTGANASQMVTADASIAASTDASQVFSSEQSVVGSFEFIDSVHNTFVIYGTIGGVSGDLNQSDAFPESDDLGHRDVIIDRRKEQSDQN
jgi:hypothetical protein